MLVARTRQELRHATREVRARHPTLALVPTMGALHAGHLSLVAHARSLGGGVVASIFINPLQFGTGEDFARYPRDEAGDLSALKSAGCDVVWIPAADEMYPAGDATLIEIGGPAQGWEGVARPGHFRGVATVVAKLFGQVGPQAACFGEKDWQQLQVIRRMCDDLAIPVCIVGVATLREPDGLAMSSRNRFLDAGERQTAARLFAALQGVRSALQAEPAARDALLHAKNGLNAAGFVVDYLALVDAATLVPVDHAQPGTRLIAAARLGRVRLLDNIDAG